MLTYVHRTHQERNTQTETRSTQTETNDNGRKKSVFEAKEDDGFFENKYG